MHELMQARLVDKFHELLLIESTEWPGDFGPGGDTVGLSIGCWQPRRILTRDAMQPDERPSIRAMLMRARISAERDHSLRIEQRRAAKTVWALFQ